MLAFVRGTVYDKWADLAWQLLLKIFWYSREFAERGKLYISWAFLFLLLLKVFVYQGYNFPPTLSTRYKMLWDYAWLLWHSLLHQHQEELREGNKLQKQKQSEGTKSSYFHKYISDNRTKKTVTNKPSCVYGGTSSVTIFLFFFCKSPEPASF